ncbi:MAG: hypothetical protein ACYDGR_11085, partial [Candidatus Dormibacteria bacterium]
MRGRVLGQSLAAVGTVAVATMLFGAPPAPARAANDAITASRETVVDPIRQGFEPDLYPSPDGTIYESPIYGFVTTQSFIQRSDDGGQTFNILGVPGMGKYDPCSGGGDSELATSPVNDLYIIDLGYAPEVPAAISNDHGNTFVPECLANLEHGVGTFADRQWLSEDTVHNRMWFIYRDGLINPGTGMDVVDNHGYGEYIKYAPMATTAGTAGAQQLLFSSLCTDPGGIDTSCLTDVQVAGGAVTDNFGPRKGNTYLSMRTDLGLSVQVINPDRTPSVVERVVKPLGSAVLFPTVAVDRA